MNLELEIAQQAALAAGEVTESYFGCGRVSMNVVQKGPGDPVTDADHAANHILKQFLLEPFPGFGWLSEESADSAERLGCRSVWIVDPIDGTKEFIEGIPEYTISIGLVVDGVPVLGVVYQPTTQKMYWGTTAEGAHVNDRRVAPITSPGEPPRIFVSRTETAKGLWEPYQDRFTREPCGSIAYKMARVAAGEADGVITLQPRSEWDIAGAAGILVAAGGRVVDHTGAPILFNREKPKTATGVIAGSAAFVEYARKALRV